MSAELKNLGMGWLPDYPDVRDYTKETDEITRLLKKTKIGVKGQKVRLPANVDLRAWCSPIENQGDLNSCTAHACAGLVEYFERKAHKKSYIGVSRLFLYKVTRDLLRWTGDRGAFPRTTMGALTLFGVPPEEYWPYDTANFDNEPSGFCYAFAENYKAIKYYRFDRPGVTRKELLNQIKTHLAAGLPSMFGFTVYNSISQASETGEIPMPTFNKEVRETVLGRHAVVAVGFDDTRKIVNKAHGSKTSMGALLIRNSFGATWGGDMHGYGWLPYDYVLQNLTADWWSLIKEKWVESGQFL